MGEKKVNFIPEIWFLSPPGFQQYIGTDFCSILPNLGDFCKFYLPYIVQIFAVFYPVCVISFLNGSRSLSARSGSFLKVPNLEDIFLPDQFLDGSRSGRYLSARSGSFLKVPDLVEFFLPLYHARGCTVSSFCMCQKTCQESSRLPLTF